MDLEIILLGTRVMVIVCGFFLAATSWYEITARKKLFGWKWIAVGVGWIVAFTLFTVSVVMFLSTPGRLPFK